jgi:16S rRNA (guanine527-N7)-methyltransferase
LPTTASHILDIGSGAGFPGLVLSIVTPHKVTLVESDQRKAIFLRTVIRELNLTADVINERIETVAPVGASIVTARALAPLQRLLLWLHPQLPSVEKCLFLKGASVREELTALESYPNIDHRIFPSVSSTDGAVLELDTSKHHGMES